MIKSIVCFNAANEKSTYDHPRGEWLARYLSEKLGQLGFSTDEIDNYRDMAWSVDGQFAGEHIWFFVGEFEQPSRQWQLIIPSSYGFIQRLFGKTDDERRAKLASAIHQILSTEPRFSNIQWFATYRPGITGSPTP